MFNLYPSDKNGSDSWQNWNGINRDKNSGSPWVIPQGLSWDRFYRDNNISYQDSGGICWDPDGRFIGIPVGFIRVPLGFIGIPAEFIGIPAEFIGSPVG